MPKRAASKRGCTGENPWLSAAWKRLAKVLEDPAWRQVRLDQCALNLRSAAGGLHLKPTRIVSTSDDVADALDLRCSGDHLHDLVEGKAVTKRSETYSQEMAELVARTVLARARRARRAGDEEHGGGKTGQRQVTTFMGQ